MPKKSKPDVSKLIKSPMPGLVKAVSCKPGDLVTENQELLIIGKTFLILDNVHKYLIIVSEAMKMQNSMSSTIAAKIKSVLVKEGDTVGEDDILVELE